MVNELVFEEPRGKYSGETSEIAYSRGKNVSEKRSDIHAEKHERNIVKYQGLPLKKACELIQIGQ